MSAAGRASAPQCAEALHPDPEAGPDSASRAPNLAVVGAETSVARRLHGAPPKSDAPICTAQALKDNRGFRVQIEGNADSTGPKEHNQTLSEARALSVLTYLRDHGIRAERLSSKGLGESNPADTNNTVEGRENNRRVDFIVKFRIIDRSAQ